MTLGLLDKARHLATRALQIQWIDGDSEGAERSFFNINQQAVPIDETELTIIQKRKKATGIAARAIIKAGKGHKYWDGFADNVKDDIERISDEIHKLLFAPTIQRPIKTYDVPICDKSDNALMLICDLVFLANRRKDDKDESDDNDGSATLSYLKDVSKVIQRMNSNFVGSYGLHPILYCYSNKGNFRAASFYGAIEFVVRLKSNPLLLKSFIENRRAFEDFIFCNDNIIQHLINVHRRSLQSAKHIVDYYAEVLKLLSEGKTQQDIVMALIDIKKYGKSISEASISSVNTSSRFSTEVKGEMYIKESYSSSNRCAICGGLLHKHSISVDHIQRQRDGGLGNVENGQLTHPYCNTGVKN